MSDNFERTSLIDQELLSLGAVEYLLSVLRNERVEERVESIVVSVFRSQNATCEEHSP